VKHAGAAKRMNYKKHVDGGSCGRSEKDANEACQWRKLQKLREAFWSYQEDALQEAGLWMKLQKLREAC
jgi:hypothetical protein